MLSKRIALIDCCTMAALCATICASADLCSHKLVKIVPDLQIETMVTLLTKQTVKRAISIC